MKTSPNHIIFHGDGTLSYRLGGRWYKNRLTVPKEDILKFPKELREKVWYEAYFLGRDLVPNVPPPKGFVWPRRGAGEWENHNPFTVQTID